MQLQLLPILYQDNHDNAKSHSFQLFQFKNVTNSAEVLKSIKKQEFPNCTVIDAQRIYSLKQVEIACTKAILNFDNSMAKSKSLYVEIMLCLSPKIAINDALKYFGIRNDTKDIFIIIDGMDDAKLFQNLVTGTFVEVPKFDNIDVKALETIYALNLNQPIEQQILNAMAIQGL